MKTLRRLCVAVVFTVALTMSAFAGEIQTTVAPPPSQAQANTTGGGIETTVAGQDETGSSEATVTDSATNAALNLIQSVLSLL